MFEKNQHESHAQFASTCICFLHFIENMGNHYFLEKKKNTDIKEKDGYSKEKVGVLSNF